MRAVRFAGAGVLEPVEIPDPEPRDGFAILRVLATGICGSDLSCYRTGVFAPAILGHEIAAVVEHGTLLGSLVTVDPKLPCGACEDCVAGAPHRCAPALTSGIGSGMPGGFAERLAVPETLLHPLPASLDPASGALAEPLSCVIHGLERCGGVRGDDAIVLGLGPIGLLAVAALRDRGATRITGVDPVPERRAIAEALGADHVAEPGAPLPHASLVVECSGRAEALATAGNVTRAGGRVLLLGLPMTEASVMPMVWVAREITLTGAVGSSPEDFAAAIDLLARTSSIAAIVTHRIGLDDVPAAFEREHRAPAGGKIVVVP